MRPHRLTVPGEYWDSHLYRGRLYLVRADGVVEVLNWDKAIDCIKTDTSTELAKSAAFARSDYLYATAFSPLFRDAEVRKLVERKFQRLSEWELEIDQKRRKASRVGFNELGMPFPYADAVIYANKLYVAASDGIHAATIGKHLKHGVSTRPTKIWDCPGFSISASWGSLAVAAGYDGLYEQPIDSWNYGFADAHQPLVSTHVSSCSYAYQSVYASSSIGEGALADFSRPERISSPYDPERGRRLQRVVTATELFGQRGLLSWGNQDKLCQVAGNAINVIRYQPWDDDGSRFRHLGHILLESWKGEVVAGGVATFGLVIEAENALVIVPSAGEPVTLRGEPVRWRFFPRSIRYENQLHVIYDDRLEVWSFNQDYFVDQRSKVAGTEFRSRPRVAGGITG